MTHSGDSGLSSSQDRQNISMENLIAEGLYNPFDDEQSNMRHRTHPHIQFSYSCDNIVSDLPSRNHAGMGQAVNGTYYTLRHRRGNSSTPQDVQVTQIIREMEKDEKLMDDNPISEHLRMETLREMPESLTMKKTIKKKLLRSISSKSRRRPISLWKNFKYRMSMSWTKFNLTLKNFLYHCELWYSSLKVIEGHFGSSVATYFRFLRFLFLLNCLVLFLSFVFVVIPQLLFRFYESLPPGSCNGDIVEIPGNGTSDFLAVTISDNSTDILTPTLKAEPYDSNKAFTFGDIFTGEGFFTNTSLYYGYYTNETVRLVCIMKYDMPSAYFFTMVVCYFIIFINLSVSMARSYRKSYIETSGGMKNIYALKIFCGWDFSVATEEAAVLRSKTIYVELKELLADTAERRREISCRSCMYTVSVRASLTILSLILIGGTGTLTWYLMSLTESSSTYANSSVYYDDASRHATFEKSMMMPLVVTFIMVISPFVFSWIVRVEDYSPRTSLFVRLLRTFLLEIVTVGVLVVFWLRRSQLHCWETSLGQEVYRLVLMDFFIAIIGTAIVEFFHSMIYKRLWKGIGSPEFDVARNTLNLIYNQTLFFMGFYFSPLLSAIVVIKMFLMFYIRKFSALYNCQQSHHSWRAAQTHTLFLGLSFLSLMGVLIAYGYIITRVQVSSCGPFRNYPFMYQMILEGILKLKQGNDFWLVIMYLTKPGVIAGILLAMLVCVYYLRSKAHAHAKMVTILREMLRSEGKDKDFLLTYFSHLTEGQWTNSKHNDSYNFSRGNPMPSSFRGGDYKEIEDQSLRHSSRSLNLGVQVHHPPTSANNISKLSSHDPSIRRNRSSASLARSASSSEEFLWHGKPGSSFQGSERNMGNRVVKNRAV